MRRRLMAGALSLGLLLPQGAGLTLAQDRAEGAKEPPAPAEKSATKKKASQKAPADQAAAEGKAAPDKAPQERAAKTQSRETEASQPRDTEETQPRDTERPQPKSAERTESTDAEKVRELDTPPKQSAEEVGRAAKSAPAANGKRGQLTQREAPRTTTPVTALEPTLEPAGPEGAKGAPLPEPTTMQDPSLRPVPPAVTPPRTPAEAAKDEDVREHVQAALLKNPSLSYTARLVRVTVKDGEITLSGQLNTQHEKLKVEHAVEKVRGKHTVHNQLRVRMPTGQTAAAPDNALSVPGEDVRSPRP